MSLGFVDIQNFFCLQIQRTVEQRKPLGDIFMYGGLADAKLPGSAPDGRLVLYDVKRQLTGALLNIPLLTIHSPHCGGSVYAGGEGRRFKTRSS